MPIYMDRHDVSEFVTAENVAQLHQEDLKVQDKFNCRGLTYWFDDIKKIAFCLIDAPDETSIQKMHNHAHGEVPHQILEVDTNLVESFLGRIKDPVNSTQKEPNIIKDPAQRTLMVLRFPTPSLKDFRISQSETSMQYFVNSMRDLLKRFEGRLVKQQQGYVLVSFKSVYNAVVSADEIKKRFRVLHEVPGNSGNDLKIGLATGMPVAKGSTFFEYTIKMADSLCFVDTHGISVSAEVKNAFMTENTDGAFQLDKLHSLTQTDENFLIQLIEFTGKEWQNTDLKVDDFGSALGMSKTRLYKKMMSLTGKSPNNFMKEYRLNHALEMINLKMKTISEIAFETGFNSTSYFSKCFQKRFGLLPSIYIKS
jgi:AraC-like DNA-binding protein